jgi:hypothetical protein
METWIALALMGGMASADLNPMPTTETSYAVARQQAVTAKKPLAVFVGKGMSSIREKLAKLDPRTRRVLSQEFVVVAIDRETPQGTRLAKDLEIKSEGVVISDRSTNLQAYSHEGDVEDDQLQLALVKYSAPDVEVKMTESNIQSTPVVTPSVAAPAAVPSYYSSPYTTYGSCPNCRRR